jgi:hypothetical protein
MRLSFGHRWCLVLLIAAIGCPRFTTEKTYSLGAGVVQRIDIDAPTYEQPVKVQIKSPGVPISVFIVTDEHAPAVQQALLELKEPDKSQVLGSKERFEEGTVEAKVPKKKNYVILLAGAAKNADVKVKIIGG